MAIARVIGAVTAFMGWRAGVGETDVVEELVSGAKETAESMDLEKKHKGNFYKYSAVTMGFGALCAALNIARSTSEFDISLHVSTISRLALMTAMMLALKDANDKELLSRKLFFQMNFMLGGWCLMGMLCLFVIYDDDAFQ